MKKVFSISLFRLSFLICFFNSGLLHAQDTIRVMQYNVLHYGVSDVGCTSTPTSTKNLYIKDIVASAQPDVLGVNEMGESTLYADNILINALRLLDPNWERTTYTNDANSNLTNMLFYKGDKLALADEQVIAHNLRDLNYYKLYYLDPNLATTNDTAFLHIIVTHLKAGSTTQDQTERTDQANVILSWLGTHNVTGNLLVMGDFNLKTSTEGAYQAFLNAANLNHRLLDPINSPGSWNGNAAFDAIHTQSTRSGSLPDCGASGGMDDRFDFIICNRNVIGDSDLVQYLPGTYKAFGNDGSHFNLSINAAPTNTAVNSLVANALYNNSDHLPVFADFRFNVTPAVSVDHRANVLQANVYPNPFENEIRINFYQSASSILLVTDLQGRIFHSETIHDRGETILHTSDWPSGVYFLNIQSENGNQSGAVKKIVKL